MTFEQFTGSNSDQYTHQRKIWKVAHDFNKESEFHLFDRFGNKLTKEVSNACGEKEIVAMYPQHEMKKRQCLKHKTLNVSRRKANRDEYEPVSLR